jgi:hypothetical protein
VKSIDTLVPDIEQVLRNSLNGTGVELTVEQQAQLGAAIAAKVARALNRGVARSRPAKTLYMSEIGKPCLRQLWYSVYKPELGEKIMPHTQFKFLYGDIIEELVLFLAKVAGHEVTGEQELIEFEWNGWTFRGRQDAIIDDVLVDVKSASSFSFKKFEEGIDDTNDPFGYRMQMQGYNLTDGKDMAWVAVDKQNGTMCVARHKNKVNMVKKLDAITKALDNDAVPPEPAFAAVPDGKSGNMKLPTECSYCSFKRECWKESNMGYGLRAFSYAGRPVFLTEVVREPKVPELDLTDVDPETATESTNAGSTA